MTNSPTSPITIGEAAARAGVRTSLLRFYEREGLIASVRTSGNQRRYPREALRRIAFIRAAQTVGLSLEEIRAALASLPNERVPTKADWERLSRSWQPRLDAQIDSLVALRSRLTQCIGCGCLSLKACKLYNRDDVLAAKGSGAHLLKFRESF